MDARTKLTAACGCVSERGGDGGGCGDVVAAEKMRAVVAAALGGAEKRKAMDDFALASVLAGLAAAAVDELADRVVCCEERIRWAEDVLRWVSELMEDDRFEDARDVLRDWREGQNKTDVANAADAADAATDAYAIERPDWW